ncbi:PaaI family thioesterase [Conyzicola sp.]|uniref:PaaI family thioesterase n=1 Tax=Conyzicola sp. TaxID=1969404 RepID=UPI003988EFE5
MDPENNVVRSRTVEWDDPMVGASRAATMPGIEYLQAMIDGEIPPPPITALMNMNLESVGQGTATFSCHPDESHYNPIGSVHGGFVCTVLDSAAGCAVQTTLPAGTGYTSLEIKVSYLRAVSTTTGPLTVVGTVTKPGSRVAFAEAIVLDGQGRTVATASSTLLVFPIPAA